jgi:MFS family permease
MIPWLVAPIGGALADRYDRAKLIAAAASLQIVQALGLAALSFAGVIEVWHLILFAIVNGVLWAGVEQPAFQALVPNTVSRPALMNAILLFGLTPAALGRLIGPIAGGPLLGGIGASWIFVFAAALSVVEIWQLRRIRVRSTGHASGSGRGIVEEVGLSLRQAIRFLGISRRARLMIALVTIHCLFVMGFDGLLPIHARDAFDGGATVFGTLLIALGVGAIAGILSMAWVASDRMRGAVFFWSGISSGVGLVILGIAPDLAIAYLGAVITGAAGTVFVATAVSALQETVPDGIRGGVLAIFLLTAGGIMPVMSFANAAASDVISTRILIAVPGAAFVVVFLIWSVLESDLRQMYRFGGGESPLPAPPSGD